MSYDKIEVLSEMEHIRNAPSMYIGSTKDPTHLVEEVLDNALDEVLAGHATTVAIKIDGDQIFICDNGRGIPINNDIPITISTKLFSGGKFKGKKTVYKITTGRHGVGLVAVNFLSTQFVLDIYRDEKHFRAVFKNGFLETKTLENFNKYPPFSTGILFVPDSNIFETTKVNLDRIRERLLYASLFTDAMFILLVNDKQEFIKLTKDSFLEAYMFHERDVERTKILSFESKVKEEKFGVDFSFALHGNMSPRIIGGVNLLPIHSGEHINTFKTIYKTEILKFAKKNRINFTNEDDVFIGLRAFVNVFLEEVEFGGQNKTSLTNRSDYFDKFKLESYIRKIISENEQIFIKILKHQKDYRQHLDYKTKTKRGAKKGFSEFTKLRDCLDSDGELFIVEGDSAAGGLVECRNPKRHAIFPLKGKPPLFNSKTLLKNKEVKELVQALGTGIGPHFNIDNLRYSRIIIATDADPDGGHIFCLTTMILYKILPEIIKQKFVYLALTPLYAISDVNKKIFVPLWTEEDLKQARNQKKNIIRIKGLGEMSPWQLKQVLIDENHRRLIPIEYPSDPKAVEKLFIDSGEKRLLLQEMGNG